MNTATYLPKPLNAALTVDVFVAEIPIDQRRSILVYHRQHGGRSYVRWRVFHKHRRGFWYPDKRRWFVVPVGSAIALGNAIAQAATGQAVTSPPAWLAEVDAGRDYRLKLMEYLCAPPEVLEQERRKRLRGVA